MISGIINVLKPAGLTSNAVISKIKKIIKPNKIGHLGTLDPSATGVLPICINKATKLFDLYLKKDKHYRAVFIFGKTTDTLDSDGLVTDSNEVIVTYQRLNDILQEFIGKQNQMPPKYSAKKVNGQSAYKLARNKVDFELKPKQIEIYDMQIVEQLAQNQFLLDIKCSSGTYVRSIASDLAKKLQTFAYMGALIRVGSGNFYLQDAQKITDITEQSILSFKNILKDRQNVFVEDKFYDKIINGCKVSINHCDICDCVVYCKNQIIGIADICNGVVKIKTNLWEKYD